MNLAPYRKFVVAAAAALGVIASFIADKDGTEVSLNDIVGMVISVLGALGVYKLRNAPLPPADRLDGDRGAIGVIEVAAILVIICAGIWLLHVIDVVD